MGIRFNKFNYLVGYHPETLSYYSVEEQFNELLKAIDSQDDSFFIFTKANADSDGRIINQMIESYANTHPEKAVLFDSLGTLRYLSAMKQVTAVVGNSSSGILEAPSAPTATINIGDRQKGRIQAESIVNCEADKDEIIRSFTKVKDSDFRIKLKFMVNPYGDGIASNKIMKVLKQISLNKLRQKSFYDINHD